MVEGVLPHRLTSDMPPTILRRGLWGVLEVFGGIKAYRPEDVGGAADRKERRAETYRARAANQRLQDYLDGLL